mmetsp:Transcript_137098/g.273440  ORF Transcript_137098/g.273440 Transcript_137098/m.273440 type:complete len:201 (+) Transcript_137098:767-1369(+)
MKTLARLVRCSPNQSCLLDNWACTQTKSRRVRNNAHQPPCNNLTPGSFPPWQHSLTSKPRLKAEESRAILNMPTFCHEDNPHGIRTNHHHAYGNLHPPACNTDSPCSSHRSRSNCHSQCLSAVALRLLRLLRLLVAADPRAQAATPLWAKWATPAILWCSASAVVLALADYCPPGHNSSASAAAVVQRNRCCSACSCPCS